MHPHHNPARPSRKRLAVVGRVSTLDQERYGTSLEDQARKGELLAQLHSMEVIDSRAYQGDESGALPLEARPIMQRLIADAQARRFDAVCFHKIDRIARKLSYILEIWDALEAAGVTVYIIEPAIDTSDMMGRLLRNILGTIAEFERDMLVARTNGGREREIANGAVYLPRGKYGYEYVKRDRAKGVMPGVRLHPKHAEVVRRMFRLKAQRWSYERIATLLTAENVPPPAMTLGHRDQCSRWDEKSIRRVIKDTTYMGQGSRGRYEAVMTERGRRMRRKPDGEYQPIDVAYPAIVTADDWHAANRDGRAGRATTVRTDAEQYLLYGGMVQCAQHDRTMSGTRARGGRRYYSCVTRLHPGGRTAHSIGAAELDEEIWDTIKAAMLDHERMTENAQQLAREAEEGMEDVVRRTTEITQRLAKLEGQLRWVYSEMRESGASATEIAEQVSLIRDEESRLHAEREPLSAQMALHRAALPKAAEIEALCRDFVEACRDADAAQKRELLEALEVTVRMDGHHYRIDGVLGPLGLEGELTAQVGQSSKRSPTMRGVPFVLTGSLSGKARGTRGVAAR